MDLSTSVGVVWQDSNLVNSFVKKKLLFQRHHEIDNLLPLGHIFQ